MNREQVINYLKSSGFVDTQIKAIEVAFTDSDCISRQAAIDAVCESKCGCKMSDCEYLFVDCSEIEKIKQLPPVKPEPKMGHWIKKRVDGRGIHHGFCSCCGFNVKRNYDYLYCPMCGAKMEGKT